MCLRTINTKCLSNYRRDHDFKNFTRVLRVNLAYLTGTGVLGYGNEYRLPSTRSEQQQPRTRQTTSVTLVS